MTRRLAKEEGLFVGWSCGSAVYGALEWAKENLNEDDTMVIILPDHGTRYLAKIYNDNWMKDHGFIESRDFATAKDIVTSKNGADKLYTVNTSDKIGDVIKMLNKEGIDQVPVVENSHFVGSISTATLVEKLIEDPEIKETSVGEVMDGPLPFVAMDNTLDVLSSMINKENRAVLVRDQQHEVHIITQHDLLMAMSR